MTHLTPPSPRTKAAAAYERLRADILSCAIPPGARLPVEFVADRYKVGPTPAREALNRLAAEGLATLAEQRGFSAAEVSPADLIELTDTRCLIEEAALRRSMQTRLPDWEEGLLLAAHRLARTPNSATDAVFRENPEWERQHAAFHAALIGGAGSRWIAGFGETLNQQFRRYRALAMGAAYPGRDAQAEHEALARAALGPDADHAARLLRRHYQRTAAIILAALGAPDPYAT
ncbi:MAG: GntR family transcriptional regulator [Rhodospirillales bacterium]|jgi:DNA-binding GntR family transcriptional regulator|nr:GntR family transcriptional regulator [Rhodospirillales bacterium]